MAVDARHRDKNGEISRIPVRVIKAVNSRTASVPAPARFSDLQCPLFARMRTSNPGG